ncbi:DUF5324 family protein [Actinacidiphila acididurans]|uniref:DUF5324 family protein n=1 Tax=Actinacidiphila acididurans TaxID=2784346 RepID=A0ABS2TUF5_9ACTN|nr:DUF5324 family protein [Actinacidiphila acididurans]MBM9505925.1 DUF5324 family protein [Actinacidiphila acididurans]
MTRIDSVRRAADVTRDGVRHAAEVAAPYATTAKEGAVRYGRQAGAYGIQYSRQAGQLARQGYEAKLAERVDQAREQAMAAVPPKAATAVENAARRTLESARAATEYTAPRVGQAVAVTRSVALPAKDEAIVRGAAVLHALRGQVTAAEIDRLVRQKMRRERAGRVMRGLVVTSLAGGAAVAAWKWWNKQTTPDWLVEPSEATEVDERATTLTVVDPLEDSATSVNGSAPHVGRVDGSADVAGLDSEPESRKKEEGEQ